MYGYGIYILIGFFIFMIVVVVLSHKKNVELDNMEKTKTVATIVSYLNMSEFVDHMDSFDAIAMVYDFKIDDNKAVRGRYPVLRFKHGIPHQDILLKVKRFPLYTDYKESEVNTSRSYSTDLNAVMNEYPVGSKIMIEYATSGMVLKEKPCFGKDGKIVKAI